jgi:hypothetical protein
MYLRISDCPQGSTEIQNSIINHETILRGMVGQHPKETAEGIRNDIRSASQAVSQLLCRRI